MIEITGICSSCCEEDILNVQGGICWQCWSNLDYQQHELELLKTEESEEE